MNFFTPSLLLIVGTLLYAAVLTNGQVFLAPAGRYLCPQGGVTRFQNPSPYPMNVLVALEQLTPGNSGNAVPAESTPPQPRCRPDASRVFTKLFSIPGAAADSFLSGDIII